MKKSTWLWCLCWLAGSAYAQSPWTPATTDGTHRARSYRAYTLDQTALAAILQKAPAERAPARSAPLLQLPLPDGTLGTFRVYDSPVMAPGLAQRYPQIRTYAAVAVDQPGTTARLDLTPQGFHALVFSPFRTVYIDPVGADTYISYDKQDAVPAQPRAACAFEPTAEKSAPLPMGSTPVASPTQQTLNFGEELRTYRLAISTTGEYAQFHGGTVLGALSAVVTTVNRVSGIYERDMAIRMELVDANDTLIFINPNTDPFTNNNGGALLGQNQTTIDSHIGNANYDIGHIFSTGGGGVAGLGVVCRTGQKARGVTGQPAPIGDPFDVDYVAHEMGHQFGANHTQNNPCNRNGSTAFEPGSASTIMGYAGICAPNLQNNSDDYFHGGSLVEMYNFAHLGIGNGCPVRTDTDNIPPDVDAGDSYIIPQGTPFVLTGTATDPDSAALLTYCWEQFDLGPAGNPDNPVGDAPIFRSFQPDTVPFRFFPRLPNLVSNTTIVGERLPTYARTMNFRLTVRDNQSGGGGLAQAATTVTVADNSGPFRLTAPNTPTATWTIGGVATITWDVANTDLAPINCQAVNLLLSSDGGFTYPDTLAVGVPNTGSYTLLIGDSLAPTTQARLRVQGADNIFFDISDFNFRLKLPDGPDFFAFSDTLRRRACVPGSLLFNVQLGRLLGFADTLRLSAVGLPGGIAATFTDTVALAPDTVQVTFAFADTLGAGTYQVLVAVTDGQRTETLAYTLDLGEPVAPTLIGPENNAPGVAEANFTWQRVPRAESYALEIATDSLFENVLVELTAIADTFALVSDLEPAVEYFWRVRASNECGEGMASATFRFAQALVICVDTLSPDVPKTIGTTPVTIFSNLNLGDLPGEVVSLDVINLSGTHSYVGDLTISLLAPDNTTVILFNQVCGNLQNFNLQFSDTASTSSIPCPPTTGLFYRSQEALSVFRGKPVAGTWRLRVRDGFFQDGGSLQSWGLALCRSVAAPVGPLSLTAQLLQPLVVGLSWTDSLTPGDTLTYLIERSDTVNNQFVVIDTIGLAADEPLAYTDTSVVPLTQYFYRVRAVLAPANSRYTNIATVVTDTVTHVRTRTFGHALTLYPNPGTGLFAVQSSLPKGTPAQVVVTDALGRQVLQAHIRLGETHLDLCSQPAGLYFVQVAVPGQTFRQRLIRQ